MDLSGRVLRVFGCGLVISLAVGVSLARAGEDVNVESLKATSWWSQVQENIRRMEYEITWKENAPGGPAFHAANRAQNLRAYFRDSGLEVVPRTGDAGWFWGFELTAFGREGNLAAQDYAAASAGGRRLEYMRDGLSEWYENKEEGIEQGYVIPSQPPGDGPLVIEGCVRGELGGVLSQEGTYVSFLFEGTEVLRYGKLMVTDARGVELPCRLELDGRRLAIVIEEEGEYPIYVDPLLSTPAWTAEIDQADCRFGGSVSSAGDVNGDGYSDVIVGAHMYDNGESLEGGAFVYHGSASGLSVTADWAAEGNQVGAFFGGPASGAGDVNGDGFDDVIVGAQGYSNGESAEGAAFVYYGGAGGLSTIGDWTAESNQASAQFAVSASAAGDVNNDGYDDVVVGAKFYDNGETNEGRAYVYHGSASGLSATADWTAESNQEGAEFGRCVSSAGDVNGDGYDDVIVGACYYANGEADEGRAYVYHGSTSGLSATADWTAESDQEGAQFGCSVSSAGDVDQDGFDDVIVGAETYDNGEIDEGRAYVYHGSALGLSATADWTAESDQAGAEFGGSVSGLEDVDGDGYDDVVVGASLYDNGEVSEGRAFAYHGSASGLSGTANWMVESHQPNAFFGSSVSGAGDINGDGYDDVIVGASGYDNGDVDEGRAYVYYGAPGLVVTADWIGEGDQVNALFGASVSSAGDINGDGYEDVIVGAYAYDNGDVDEGRAFAYHGSSSGLSTTPAWTAESDQAGAEFGRSVSSAGDVNGDGYDDVIVGADYYDNGQVDEGRAFVYQGSSSGLSATATWTAECDQANAYFGCSVSGAGDVNDDGFGDVIVGAYWYAGGYGGAFVYHGASSGLSATAVWTAVSDRTACFGKSVSSAGDVNGDGYSDVIVGADNYSNGETIEGRAFVYHGGSSGLSAGADWTAESNQDLAYFGRSVSGAGDVNGDGYSDVIVGADNYSNGEANEGRAFVYHGSASGLTLTPNWTAESDQAYANLGWSVSGAGDVNGDGFEDVIVGAYRYDNGETDEGRAFLYHGSTSGLSATADWRAESDQAYARFGNSVSGAGDVNGDGYSDIIVGAYWADNDHSNEGAAFVYYGSGPTLSVTADWIGESDQPGADFGASVASAGDVDNDGYDDVIVGAYGYDNGEADEGSAFVYRGSASGLSVTAAWTAEGNQIDANFGYSVSSAGDVNGDGYDDVVIGASMYSNGEFNEGGAYVYHGSASGLSATADWTAESDQASAEFGSSVSSAGDANGDGYDDVIVGALRYDNGEANEGRAYVYHGSASGLSATSDWTAEGDRAQAYFGSSVSSAGDVNADGYDDVIVGAWLYGNGEANEGGAFVYQGSASGLSATADWTAESDQAGARFGASVSSAGDVNGDGYADVIVGAYDYDNGEFNEGGAFVYHGSASGLSVTAGWTGESNQATAEFGFSVSSAGDVNGDGYADVIVGAPWYDHGESNEGRAFVYRGSASGLSATAEWMAESDQEHAHFGTSVSSGGDVNGDGFSDIIVGAHSADNGQLDEGAAFVYYGSGPGLPPAPDWTAEGDQAGAEFGYSVSSAGDVNGDGYGDVIVGASRYDNGEADEGRAFVYHGSPSGLSASSDWTAEGDQVSAVFGWSVSGAGDVNDDGYDDVIVSAIGYDNGELNEGRVYVYHGGASGLSGTADWTAEGNQVNASFGWSVSGAGDVNEDGYDEVIIGANSYDNGENDEGGAFAYQGSASGLSASPDWTAESDQASALFGESVSSAGDVNGDGYDDVIVGAYLYDNGLINEGGAFVYHGGASGLSGTADWTAESDQFRAKFGSSVSSAGDVNGDGYGDVIVGAIEFDNGETDEGGAFVYHGGAGGLSAIAAQVMESDQQDAGFGQCVSNVGDVDGDGYDDVIVGAYLYDNGEVDEGCVFLYTGGPTGISGTAAWHADSDQAGAELGRCVSGAGDVNGDGSPDIIVGANLYESGAATANVRASSGIPAGVGFAALQTDEGAAFLYFSTVGTVDVPGVPGQGYTNVLFQNYPNPFRGITGTTIRYSVAKAGKVEVRIFDVAGRLVNSVERVARPGDNFVVWDGRSGDGRRLASGVYFYQIRVEGFRAHKKMILLQ